MERTTGTLLAVMLFYTLHSVQGIDNVVTHTDQLRLSGLLQDGLKQSDMDTLFYSVSGLKSIKKDVPEPENVCNVVASHIDASSIDSLWKAAEIKGLLNCKFSLPDVTAFVNGLITEDSTVKDLAGAISVKSLLGLKVEKTDISILDSALRKDDTPTSAGYAFCAAGMVGKDVSVKGIVEMVEDIVAQADEIDGSMLQFDGGLEVTSRVVKGILVLSKREGKALLTEEQALKFSRYFVNRKYVLKLKDVYSLLSAVSVLADNTVQVPVVISLFRTMIVNEKNPEVKVRVTNLLDKSLPGADVTMKSVTSEDSNLLVENVAMKKGPDDDYVFIESPVARGYIAASTYVLDLMAKKPAKGVYTCTVKAEFSKEGKIFIGGSDSTLRVKVVTRVVVEDAEIAVMDKDRSSAPSPLKIRFPDKLATDLEADYHQKVLMSFALKDMATGEHVTAHQVFIRLTHISTGQEIFFVAEPESTNVYKFNLDIGATAKDSFNNLGGKYKMDLIVGDAAIQIPIKWNVGVISLTFAEETQKTKRQERVVGPKPAIEHMFRVPERRPAKVISNTFTGLIFVPFILMFAMWFKVGANVSNLNCSLSTIIFHLGLAGIFILYFFFWYKLDMFQTLKYLAVIGSLTFLGGNKMLATKAAKKQGRAP